MSALGSLYAGEFTTVQGAIGACDTPGKWARVRGARGFAGECRNDGGVVRFEEFDLGVCDGSEFVIGATQNSSTDIWVKSGAIASWGTDGLTLSGEDDVIILSFLGNWQGLYTHAVWDVLCGQKGSSFVTADRFGTALEVPDTDATNNEYCWSLWDKVSTANEWRVGFAGAYASALSEIRRTSATPTLTHILARCYTYEDRDPGNDFTSGLRGLSQRSGQTFTSSLGSGSQFSGGFSDPEHLSERRLALFHRRDAASESSVFFRKVRLITEVEA